MIKQMFQGRIGVADYWKAFLIAILVLVGGLIAAVAVAFVLLGPVGGFFWPVFLIPTFVILVPSYLGLAIRRVHDIGLPAWTMLIFVATNYLLDSLSSGATTISGQTPLDWLLLGASLALGLALGLWPGTAGQNAYGAPATYRSWWAALIGSKS